MNPRRTLGIGLSAFVMAGAASASAQAQAQAQSLPIEPVRVLPAPAPVPSTEATRDELDSSLLTTGGIVFATSYGGAVIVAAISDHVGDDRLYIPVVGPWLDVVDRGTCPVELHSCDGETSSKVFLVADGVFQAAGLVSMIDAAFVRIHHPSAAEARREYEKIHVTPASLGYAAPGFAVSGHF